MANDNPPATMGYNVVLKIQDMAHEAAKQYRATSINTSLTTLPAEVANGVTDWLSWLSWHTTAADVEAEPRIAPTIGELSNTLLPHINEPPGYGTSNPAIGNAIFESGDDEGLGQRPSPVVPYQEEEAAYFLFGDYASLMDLTGLELLELAG